MKVLFEVSPEEREEIIQQFEERISQNPVTNPQELMNILSDIIINIMNSGKDSILLMCTKCVQETLEESPIYQALIKQFEGTDIYGYDDNSELELQSLLSKEDEFIDKWNDAIKRKEYFVVESKYSS